MKRPLKIAAIALTTAIVLITGYGVLIEPRFILDERHHTMTMPGLGPEHEGTTIAVIADLQVGMWWANTGMVERAVRELVDEDPDAVLLGGDFLYSSDPSIAVQADAVLDLLSPLLDSGIPTFAVMGNHDYKVGGAERMTTALEERGVDVLLNEAAPLPGKEDLGPAQQFYVVGVGPKVPGQADAELALEGVPENAPRMVLMHNPTTFRSLPAGSAPLAVAGHTHCGQIAIPGLTQWSYLDLTAEEKIVADGFAPHDYGAAGNQLFVTCGIGFSVVPMRINAAPQIAFFEFVADRGTS
ncbi:metallophosphoesterase [Lolliginicoccus levis]|uniref:metallophosphoesterase n=1 Tax=Lolliginicoccus levis TaxID=2919542 RepID=UPI00241DA531|nr:metallophosphoesterase [Lolliginicoccus levis]